MPKSRAMRRTGLFLAVSLAASAAWLAPSAAGALATWPAWATATDPTPAASATATGSDPSPEDQESPDPAPGSELRVSLITVGAGPVVYEMFGHNAIRIQDPATGLDVSYNWGMFDVSQEGFFWRFLLGDWQYWMAGLSSEGLIARYVASDRGVVEQELDLAPARRLQLLEIVELNRRPENAYYRYQYFLDNCSTRARDALDAVLGNSLRARFANLPGETFRFHTRRLTAGNALVYVSLDFFMSGRGDRPVTAWDEMFIPMMMRDFLRATDLVTSEAVLDEPARIPLGEPPRRFLWFALTGVLLAGLLASSAWVGAAARVRAASPRVSRLARAEFAGIAGLWSLVAGLFGLVMIVSHFTAHEFMHWNENFLQANPLSLVLAVALVPAVFAGRWRRLATRTALLAAGVSVLGLVMQVVPGIDQVNGYHLAVTVPAHLAVAWGVQAMVRAAPEPSATS